jgi:hypothetical protein
MAASFFLENTHFQSANATTNINNWGRQSVPRIIYKLMTINRMQ